MPAKPSGQAGSGKGKSKVPSKVSPKPSPKASTKRCPVCGKPAAAASLPFCSDRCRDVDLNRWLSGSYVIPGTESDEEDAE
jgi:endogenous inhibitor of DNA gyrase (YacG/DUF329 family)